MEEVYVNSKDLAVRFLQRSEAEDFGEGGGGGSNILCPVVCSSDFDILPSVIWEDFSHIKNDYNNNTNRDEMLQYRFLASVKITLLNIVILTKYDTANHNVKTQNVRKLAPKREREKKRVNKKTD